MSLSVRYYLGAAELSALPVSEELLELGAALALNKTQLARAVGVSRPTLYEWLADNEPNLSKLDRLHTLLRILRDEGVTASEPLNARFVCQAPPDGEPSLLDLISDAELDEVRIASAIARARDLTQAVARRRMEREQRLRALGFEEQSAEQRKE